MLAHALTWSSPPGQVTLPPEEIHIWRASLDRPLAFQESLLKVLSEDERERALRYTCLPTRSRFVVGRGLLRTILARYLNSTAGQVRFRVCPQGKPILDEQHPRMHFNVSHSHNLVLIAVTHRGEVGIDVERVRPFANDLNLAERYFSPRECRMLRLLSPERRTEAFFHAWTRKEACLKALGVGLSYGLDRVEVTIRPEDPVRLLRLDGEEKQAAPWSLLALAPAPGYVGALAIKARQGFRLVAWHWPEE
jgi:4'-phosphopantetheinyl transferase